MHYLFELKISLSNYFLVLRFPIFILEIYFLGAADRVFGPATTTRHVYDVAAQQVVSGAMQGINGNYLTSLKLKD